MIRVLMIAFLFFFFTLQDGLAADPPSQFDLRDVNGNNYVTSVKNQKGGTCWTHGAMAAMESNLLMTGNWALAGEVGEPNLAEYHLDWWNGFNRFNNDDTDPPKGGGLMVHNGGDYRVTSAYLTRGEGAVRDIDGQSYGTAPERSLPSYHYYYTRDIEWLVAGADLSNINAIKEKIMSDGVIGTCMAYSGAFMSGNRHYQPPSSTMNPNHAIGIIGWDDNKSTQAPKNGAWLCKNSWGTGWGSGGYFWISYYDKHCCQHPEMGAISFQDVELMPYDIIYYHDYHGWRDTLEETTEAFNGFIAKTVGEMLCAVSFFTAADQVTYTVKIFDRFEGGELQDELVSQTGFIDVTGFHTIDLNEPLLLSQGQDFYIYVSLSGGGQPFDRSSEVPVLLGADYRVWVESSSSPGQSYYREDGIWKDLYDDDETANFCIKGITYIDPPLNLSVVEGIPQGFHPIGLATDLTLEVKPGVENYMAGTAELHYRFHPDDPYTTLSLTPVGGDLYEVQLPETVPGDEPEFYFSAVGDQGTKVYAPYFYPEEVYTFDICLMEPHRIDDFETDTGWTVKNIAMESGKWERGDPGGTGAQPEDDHSADGTKCFVTGKSGGAPDDDEVDGISTFLYSPVFDLHEGDGIVSFYCWFHHTDTGYYQPFEIYLAAEQSQHHKIIVLHHDPLWKFISFRVSDYFEDVNAAQVYMRAWDSHYDDIVEALIDDFRVDHILSDPSLWADAYSIPVSTGASIHFSLDAGLGHANRTYLMLGSLSGTLPGFTFPSGQVLPLNWDAFTDLLLMLIGSPVCPNFYSSLDATGKGGATLHVPGPLDPVLLGTELRFAYVLDPGSGWSFTSNSVGVEFE
jgi:C1A family cysteine protease